MQFVISVYGAPDISASALSAYRFAKTVRLLNHNILQIFFYQEGIFNSCRNLIPWSDLNSPLCVCRTAALKAGIAQKHLNPGFKFSGLTQFFSALLKTDRYVVFSA